LIRITGETGEEVIPLIRDEMAHKYDVIVDDAPTSPNVKEKTFGILREILPALMQAGTPIPPDLIEYTPLPESLISKWKEHIANQGKDPMQDKMKQLAVADKEADVMTKQADVKSKEAKAMLDMANAQKAMSEAGQAPAPENNQLQVAEFEHKRQVDVANLSLAAKKLQLEEYKTLKEESKPMEGEEMGLSLEELESLVEQRRTAKVAEQETAQRAQMEKDQEAQMRMAQTEAVLAAINGVAQGMAALGNAIQQQNAIAAAPKRIIEDARGKPIGVEVVSGS
jgi:myosin heavy subunit